MGKERKGGQAGNKFSCLAFLGNGFITSAKGTASYFNPKPYMPDRAARAGGAEEPKATVPGGSPDALDSWGMRLRGQNHAAHHV